MRFQSKTWAVGRMALLLGFALSLTGQVSAAKFSAETIARIEAAKVGETLTIAEPAGDGCNVCSVYYVKISDAEIRATGSALCTLKACLAFPPIRFREGVRE